MTGEVKQWWEETSAYFQDEIDMGVGVDWTGPGAPDIDLFGDVAGTEMLELGCGGGQCTVALANRGANITGLDLSTEQLEYARDLAAEHDVDLELLQGTVTDLGMFDDDSFDVAFNAFVFQWVDDLGACFAETHRVLRPGGRFVFSMPHPFYEITDPETHTVEESYFDTGEQVTEYEEMDIDQVTYRRTVSDVYNAVRETGFEVTEMLEPGTEDPEAYDTDLWEFQPAHMALVPPTLIVDAHKPAE
jgi:ubiquinone/menaquinone biosynthesis C-methylase UbiE